MSRPSMAATTLLPSTRKSPISYTTNCMSSTPQPSPYRCTPPPPTARNEKRLSSFSKKNMPGSGCSNGSSKWPTTMQPSCTASLRTRPSTQTSTGENSPGDQCRNGNNRRRHHKMSHRPNDASATPSASHSNRCTGYNPQANESDYNDNETPDIVDLYGDEVYNNID